jgi:hypothetical protein
MSCDAEQNAMKIRDRPDGHDVGDRTSSASGRDPQDQEDLRDDHPRPLGARENSG